MYLKQFCIPTVLNRTALFTLINIWYYLQGMLAVVLPYITSSFCFCLNTTTTRISFTFHCIWCVTVKCEWDSDNCCVEMETKQRSYIATNYKVTIKLWIERMWQMWSWPILRESPVIWLEWQKIMIKISQDSLSHSRI